MGGGAVPAVPWVGGGALTRGPQRQEEAPAVPRAELNLCPQKSLGSAALERPGRPTKARDMTQAQCLAEGPRGVSHGSPPPPRATLGVLPLMQRTGAPSRNEGVALIPSQQGVSPAQDSCWDDIRLSLNPLCKWRPSVLAPSSNPTGDSRPQGAGQRKKRGPHPLPSPNSPW